MRLLVRAGAAFCCIFAGPVGAQPDEALPIVEVTYETVDLTGAGLWTFNSWSPDLSLEEQAAFGSDPLEAKLWFDPSGEPIRCDPYGKKPALERVQALFCDEALVRAWLKLPRGFMPSMTKGFVTIRFWLQAPLGVVADRPIKFVAKGQGALVTVGYRPGPRGRCLAFDFNLPAISPTELCDAVKAAPREVPGRCGLSEKTPTHTDIWDCWVAVHEDRDAPRLVNAVTSHDSSYADIRYPDPDLEAKRMLPEGSGQLSGEITSNDYPLAALQYRIEGTVNILLGIARSGVITTCTPVKSSGVVLLDNKACSLTLERLRFVFEPDVEAFDGLRYHAEDFRWNMTE